MVWTLSDDQAPIPDLRMPPRPEDITAILRRRRVPTRYRVPDEEDVTDFRYAGVERLALMWAEIYNALNTPLDSPLHRVQQHRRRVAVSSWNAWYRVYLSTYRGRFPFRFVIVHAKRALRDTARQPFWPHRYMIDRV